MMIQVNKMQVLFETEQKLPMERQNTKKEKKELKLPELLVQSLQNKKRKYNQMEISMDKFLSKKQAIFSNQKSIVSGRYQTN